MGCQLVTAIAMITRRLTIPEYPRVFGREEDRGGGATPFSPQPGSVRLFLFPKLKWVIKGTRFENVDAIKKAATTELKSIPQKALQSSSEQGRRGRENA